METFDSHFTSYGNSSALPGSYAASRTDRELSTAFGISQMGYGDILAVAQSNAGDSTQGSATPAFSFMNGTNSVQAMPDSQKAGGFYVGYQVFQSAEDSAIHAPEEPETPQVNSDHQEPEQETDVMAPETSTVQVESVPLDTEQNQEPPSDPHQESAVKETTQSEHLVIEEPRLSVREDTPSLWPIPDCDRYPPRDQLMSIYYKVERAVQMNVARLRNGADPLTPQELLTFLESHCSPLAQEAQDLLSEYYENEQNYEAATRDAQLLLENDLALIREQAVLDSWDLEESSDSDSQGDDDDEHVASLFKAHLSQAEKARVEEQIDAIITAISPGSQPSTEGRSALETFVKRHSVQTSILRSQKRRLQERLSDALLLVKNLGEQVTRVSQALEEHAQTIFTQSQNLASERKSHTYDSILSRTNGVLASYVGDRGIAGLRTATSNAIKCTAELAFDSRSGKSLQDRVIQLEIEKEALVVKASEARAVSQVILEFVKEYTQSWGPSIAACDISALRREARQQMRNETLTPEERQTAKAKAVAPLEDVLQLADQLLDERLATCRQHAAEAFSGDTGGTQGRGTMNERMRAHIASIGAGILGIVEDNVKLRHELNSLMADVERRTAEKQALVAALLRSGVQPQEILAQVRRQPGLYLDGVTERNEQDVTMKLPRHAPIAKIRR